jgi:hypothetical protein
MDMGIYDHVACILKSGLSDIGDEIAWDMHEMA